jgi:hypothetical protein
VCVIIKIKFGGVFMFTMILGFGLGIFVGLFLCTLVGTVYTYKLSKRVTELELRIDSSLEFIRSIEQELLR